MQRERDLPLIKTCGEAAVAEQQELRAHAVVIALPQLPVQSSLPSQKRLIKCNKDELTAVSQLNAMLQQGPAAGRGRAASPHHAVAGGSQRGACSLSPRGCPVLPALLCGLEIQQKAECSFQKFERLLCSVI